MRKGTSAGGLQVRKEKDLKMVPPDEHLREDGVLSLKSRVRDSWTCLKCCHVGAGLSILSVALDIKRLRWVGRQEDRTGFCHWKWKHCTPVSATAN